MDYKSRCNLYLVVFIWLVDWWSAAAEPSDGHFKCTWHSGQPTAANNNPLVSDTSASCSVDDSIRLSFYVNHCTKQNYVPLLACKDTGQWNCDSFLAMCKTMIRSDPSSTSMTSPTTEGSRRDISGRHKEPYQKPAVDPNDNLKEFNPDENYFTMKEMAIAVLVSFITGATVLALVIFVVWRWRNCHVDSENRRVEERENSFNMVSLRALGQLVQAIGLGQDKNGHSSVVNPNYGQLVTARDILEDVMNEQAYEEIFTRRKSSCQHGECIYASVDKTRSLPSVMVNKPAKELKRIDESAESDVGYEGDINITPQTPRRFVKYLNPHAVYSVPRSPAGSLPLRPLDADMLRTSLNNLNRELPNPVIDKDQPNDKDNDNHATKGKGSSASNSLPSSTSLEDCIKSDSGYANNDSPEPIPDEDDTGTPYEQDIGYDQERKSSLKL